MWVWVWVWVWCAARTSPASTPPPPPQPPPSTPPPSTPTSPPSRHPPSQPPKRPSSQATAHPLFSPTHSPTRPHRPRPYPYPVPTRHDCTTLTPSVPSVPCVDQSREHSSNSSLDNSTHSHASYASHASHTGLDAADSWGMGAPVGALHPSGGILPNPGGGGSVPHTPKGPRAFDDLSILDMSSHGVAPVESVVVTTQEQCMDLMVNGKYRPPLPIRTPAPWTTLMQACWAHDPRDRPEFNEVVAKVSGLGRGEEYTATTFSSLPVISCHFLSLFIAPSVSRPCVDARLTRSSKLPRSPAVSRLPSPLRTPSKFAPQPPSSARGHARIAPEGALRLPMRRHQRGMLRQPVYIGGRRVAGVALAAPAWHVPTLVVHAKDYSAKGGACAIKPVEP